MHVHNEAKEHAGDERHEAVRSIARMLLTERLDELSVTAQGRLDRAEPAYAHMRETTPGQKLWGMRTMLELALTRLAGDSIPSTLASATERVGRERAEQGIPLTAIVHSFQLDLRILWEAIIERGRAEGLADDPGFLDGLLLAWEAINSNNVEVVDAYRRREADLDSHRVEVRNRAFERLILDGSHDDAVVAESSAALDIPLDGKFIVVVVDGAPTEHRAVSRCRIALQRSALRFHFGYLGGELLGIVHCAHNGPDIVHTALEPLGEWRCGTAEIDRLAQTPLGVRLARAAIRSDAAPGLRPLKSHWIGAIMGGNEELTGLMAREIVTPLMTVRDRDGVLDTLIQFLAIGSIADVAERTFRHRNTIRNRLQAVETATGLSLTVPTDVALLTMAVEWLKSPSGREFSASHA